MLFRSGGAGTSPSAGAAQSSGRPAPPSARPTSSSVLPSSTVRPSSPARATVPFVQPTLPSARPRIAIPGVTSPGAAAPSVVSPGAASPGAASPETASPETASPGTASPGTTRQGAVPPGAAGQIPPRDLGRDVTAIGDSVMLAAAQQLRAVLPGTYIDAQVSRQMSQGIAVLRELARRGKLRPIVVVGLGTNGVITMPQVRTLQAVAGPRRTLVLVNTFVPRPWQSEVNTVLAAAARRYGDVTIADWNTTIRNRTGLLWGDGVHPRPPGAVVYARMVTAAVRQAARRIESLAPARQPPVPSRSSPAGASRSPPAIPSPPPAAGWQWHKLGA